MPSKQSASLAGLAFAVPRVLAGFMASSSDNIAVYWGQNSAGGADTQSRLATYCSNTDINIIPLAFMDVIVDPTTVNFANADNNCTTFSGTTLLDCPQIEADIQTCQSTYNKTILLSIGGSTYTEGGFTSESEAEEWANTIWYMFGPVTSNTSINRPFGSAVVDGFDFDFESTTSNMAPFASQLRSNMDAATDKTYYLSAAPQCVYPDAADNEMLDGAVYFDWISIQFYNNYCEASNFVAGSTTQNDFDYATWDTWAKNVSLNPDVKLLLGLPASTTAAGSGYVSGTLLDDVIAYCKDYSSFGGVMMWDMSQVYANTGYLEDVVSALGSSSGSTPSASTTPAGQTTLSTSTTKAATTTTTPAVTSPSPVAQWGQCGGEGYSGSTECESPYTCVENSSWWSQCE